MTPEAFQSDWTAWLDAHVAPQAEDLEQAPALPRAALQGLASRGFYGLAAPAARGGRGLPKLMLRNALEDLARRSPTLALVASIPLSTAHVVADYASGPEQEALAARLCAGEAFCAFAYTEAGGAPGGAFATRAERAGETGYRLHGSKSMISWGGEADLYLTIASLAVDEKTLRPATFLVPRAAAGVSFGELADKMAFPALMLRDVRLEATELPAASLLGKPGFGLKIATEVIHLGRLCMSSVALGLSECLMQDSLDRTTAPRPGGGSLADLPTVQFQLAEMKLRLEACRQLVATAWERWSEDDPERVLSIALAKAEAARAVMFLADQALQLQGGAGYLQGNLMERRFRQARLFGLVEGTTEIQLVTIANRLLAGRR